MPANDDAAARLKDAGRLIEQLRQLQAKEYEVTEELMGVLRGDRRATGGDIKRVAAYFDAVWGARYAGGQKGRYVWAWTKDTPQLKRLLRALTAQQLETRMFAYLRNDDPFYTRARHSFAVFVASINSHVEAAPVAREPANAWTELCVVIEALVARHTFHQWFKPLKFVEETDSLIRVSAPNELFVEWVRKHHAGDIEEARRRTQQMKHVDISAVAGAESPL